MLVFISDTHLTDGTSGETIKEGAFKKFAFALEHMAIAAGAHEIKVVMLGDIFDIIRSDHWLRGDIRPWADTNKRDAKGKSLHDYTKEIVNKICNNPTNKKSMQYLDDFKKLMIEKGVNVNFTYIVGNHDWLINRYADTRVKIAKFLGMDKPQQYKNKLFSTEGFWDEYRVFARHGDIYDPFNFDSNRDASSLGDAIVIDLINRFPKAVEKAIGNNSDPDLISELREIDNVRPLIDIPLWIQGTCRRAKSADIGERVKEVWNDLVDDFLDIDFVKAHDKPWRIDVVDAMQMGLRISKYLTWKDLANLPLRKFQKTEADYRDKAFHEDIMRRNDAEFVLYGHTHGYKIQPLDQVPMSEKTIRKTYFNAGTWRKVHVRTAYDVENQEFLCWHVLTFIAFYSGKERDMRRFEIWNGALG